MVIDTARSLSVQWETPFALGKKQPQAMRFFELPDLLLTLDPTLREPMLGCVLAIDIGKLEEFMQRCTSLQCTVPLSPWRAKFMLRMVKRRQALFLEQLS